jgi:NADPH-dependent glutamate synthase beta subunit-like oxidoreductase/NAD(P)H-flavin reductase
MSHAAMPAPELRLGIPGFTYADLHRPQRLADLMRQFEGELKASDPAAWERLSAWRAAPDARDAAAVSETILAVAPHVERFVARLFGVEQAVRLRSEAIRADDPVFAFKREFVKKRVLKAGAGKGWGEDTAGAAAVARVAVAALAGGASGAVSDEGDEELAVSRAGMRVHDADETARRVMKQGGAAWGEAQRATVSALRAALRDDAAARLALLRIEGGADALEGGGEERDFRLALRVGDALEAWLAARAKDRGDPASRWALLHVPHKWNFESLVQLRRSREDLPEEFVGPEAHRRERVEPFALTDPRGSRRLIAAHVDYCLYCHDRDKDSCSKGLRDKAGGLKKNPLGVELAGCPLFEKISEMHLLRRAGGVLSALATAMIDNPMLAGTGHRICNDCMKGCVYQTQEPVDIPQVETRILTDVLALPWGFEIWSLLTRWNPLNPRRPVAAPYNGRNVLIVGLGPAGYTLAHHLLNEGFGVVGIDGLKIEPMPAHLVGDDDTPPQPVYDVSSLREPLESRVVLGFGGVSEYGITVRWDKTFLSVLFLNLLRRRTFRAYGGVRFGGTLDLDDARALGFDHVALAAGAGKPTLVPIENNLIRGVRKASDFLMALQLSGAFKRESLSNLQVRLPGIVIGGGLTAIDTATEMLAYYVVQAERTLARYEQLVAERGEAAVRAGFDAEELGILDEVVAHGRAIRQERLAAAREGRQPRLQRLLDEWGGVSIVYRRRLKDSPAYRLNHEEVAKSLEEGVRYVELMSPVAAHPDAFGAVEAMTFERQRIEGGKLVGTGELVRLPARTVCIAAGTSPNTTYEKEYPGTFALDERSGYFLSHRAVVAASGEVTLEPDPGGAGFFTSYQRPGRDAAAPPFLVSYYGDNHPRYAGSVVKAMASAKDGHGRVAALFAAEFARQSPADQPARDAAWRALTARLDGELRAVVHDVRRLARDIVEVVVHAPLAARKFRPGQFYRLQNFERGAPRTADGERFVMEGLALTGAWTDPERGLLSTIVLEMGASSRMCAMLRKGEEVVLMGPTGAPTEIASDETVLLAGGGLGNAVLFSIARAFKARGARVIYFAGYRYGESVFKREEIEASTDQVIWAYDQGTPIEPRRPQDASFHGNIVQAMLAYERGELGDKRIDLGEVDRIIAIGSDRMMNAVREARHGPLAPYLKKARHAIGSINSPMQCMMKQICAQCLQRVVDPETGKEELVYTCFNQDMELDRVDFAHLAARLRQNSAQEKLANLWFDRMVERASDVPRV